MKNSKTGFFLLTLACVLLPLESAELYNVNYDNIQRSDNMQEQEEEFQRIFLQYEHAIRTAEKIIRAEEAKKRIEAIQQAQRAVLEHEKETARAAAIKDIIREVEIRYTDKYNKQVELLKKNLETELQNRFSKEKSRLEALTKKELENEKERLKTRVWKEELAKILLAKRTLLYLTGLITLIILIYIIQFWRSIHREVKQFESIRRDDLEQTKKSELSNKVDRIAKKILAEKEGAKKRKEKIILDKQLKILYMLEKDIKGRDEKIPPEKIREKLEEAEEDFYGLVDAMWRGGEHQAAANLNETLNRLSQSQQVYENIVSDIVHRLVPHDSNKEFADDVYKKIEAVKNKIAHMKMDNTEREKLTPEDIKNINKRIGTYVASFNKILKNLKKGMKNL